MFLESLISKVKNKLWIYFLPSFISKSKASIETYNYYSVYFSDVKQEKYVLSKVIGKSVVLEKWNKEIKSYSTRESFSITELEMMNVEIVHWVKNGPLRFDSILSFSINYFTRIAYIKSSISRTKSRISSKLHNNDEMIGLDRVNLLHMLINEYVNQAPDKTHIGVTSDEIIDMIYGHLWRNYIKMKTSEGKHFCFCNHLLLLVMSNTRMDDTTFRGKPLLLSWPGSLKRKKKNNR